MLTWGRRDSERHASFQKDPCRFRRHCFGSEGSLQFGRTSPDLERPASFQKDPLRFRKTRFGFERLLPIQQEPLRFRKPSRARRHKNGGLAWGSNGVCCWAGFESKGAAVDPDYNKGGRGLDQKATKQAVIGLCVNLRGLWLASQQRRGCCWARLQERRPLQGQTQTKGDHCVSGPSNGGRCWARTTTKGTFFGQPARKRGLLLGQPTTMGVVIGPGVNEKGPVLGYYTAKEVVALVLCGFVADSLWALAGALWNESDRERESERERECEIMEDSTYFPKAPLAHRCPRCLDSLRGSIGSQYI